MKATHICCIESRSLLHNCDCAQRLFFSVECSSVLQCRLFFCSSVYTRVLLSTCIWLCCACRSRSAFLTGLYPFHTGLQVCSLCHCQLFFTHSCFTLHPSHSLLITDITDTRDTTHPTTSMQYLLGIILKPNGCTRVFSIDYSFSL